MKLLSLRLKSKFRQDHRGKNATNTRTTKQNLSCMHNAKYPLKLYYVTRNSFIWVSSLLQMSTQINGMIYRRKIANWR